jgi:hypothetical protein
MECTEFEKAWSEVLERSRLSPAAREHVDQCPRCSSLLGDMESIRHRAQVLYDQEPPVDLWPSIRQVLIREGIIRKPEPEPELAPHLVRSAPLSRSEA